MRFDQKVAVITGATSGIGEACARLFVSLGAKVVLVGRSAQRGAAILQELQAVEQDCLFIACDIAKEEQVNRLAEQVLRHYGKVDILFNNAGVMLPPGEIECMPVEDWKRTFDVNVNGMFYVCRAFKPLLAKSTGCMINNASIAGMQSYSAGRSYAYSASKAAVIQFSRQMAKNYGCEGIRVNCICPGIIDTPLLGERVRAVYAERVARGYVAKPEAVASVVAFLASADAAYLTGVALPVDGGASL